VVWLQVPVSLPLASTGTTSRTSELLCGLVLTQILNILLQNDFQASNASNASGPLPSRHFLWHGSRSVTLDCSPWASSKLCGMVNSSLGKMSSIRIIFTLILKQSRCLVSSTCPTECQLSLTGALWALYPFFRPTRICVNGSPYVWVIRCTSI
jgi:hypothetical protein